MRKNILLPTDYSDNAWNAIRYALELYKNEECDFYILNTFDAQNQQFEQAKAESGRGLAKVLNSIKSKEDINTKHSFKIVTAYKNVLDAVREAVEENDIEMIVMGTKGETNSRTIVMGTNAINIMEKLRNCPVIVVPEVADISWPTEIVFPTGYKNPFKKRELNYLIEITKKSNASIKVLHIKESEQLDVNQIKNKKILEKYFEGIDHTFHLLTYMTKAAAINCFVESRGSDMVAFINKKHTFFGSLLTQPLVKEIGYQSQIPILVLHDN